MLVFIWFRRAGASLAGSAAAINPLGPIFGKELRVTSRKKRSYALRVGYLALLLLSLLMVYAAQGRRYGGIAQQAQQQAELGATFFATFSLFCVITMGLISPVLTSTSIGSEKLAKTLPVLMMTPISTWQIVTGKLLSRLLAALTLMGLSLPVLALVRLLGGVELDQMIAVLCLCTSFAFSSAAIGLLYSTFINRAYAVILLSYATLGFLYLFIPMIIALCIERHQRMAMDFLNILLASHPVMSVYAMASPDNLGRVPVTIHWGVCSIAQVVFAVGLLTLSGLGLRRTARREGARETSVSPDSYIPIVSLATQPPPLPASAPSSDSGPTRLLPIPSPAAEAAVPPAFPAGLPVANPASSAAAPVVPYRSPGTVRPARVAMREVSDNPILWREIRRPLLARVWMRATAAITCIVLLLATYIAMGSAKVFEGSRHEEQIGFAITFSVLFWLLAAVLSATAIASEKESDTWTLLLATPVTGEAVVWGKVAGLLRRLLWPTVIVAAHFLLFTLIGHVEPLSVLFVIWVMITFNSIWIATGLYLSLRMRKVTFAVITNLVLAVVFYAVVPSVIYVFTSLVDGSDRWVEQGVWQLPYMYLGNFFAGYRQYDTYSGDWTNVRTYYLPGDQRVSYIAYWLTVLGIGCVHLLVSYLILSRTAALFDSIVGRAGKHVHAVDFDADEAVALASGAGYAGFWRRAFAFGIDSGILHLGCSAIGLLAGAAVLITRDENAIPPGQVMARCVGIALVASIVVGWPYYALFESSRRRATPGKSLMGIFVTDADGRRVPFNRASGRYFSKLLSGLLLTAGYIIAAFSPRKRALHDMLADTQVLKR